MNRLNQPNQSNQTIISDLKLVCDEKQSLIDLLYQDVNHTRAVNAQITDQCNVNFSEYNKKCVHVFELKDALMKVMMHIQNLKDEMEKRKMLNAEFLCMFDKMRVVIEKASAA